MTRAHGVVALVAFAAIVGCAGAVSERRDGLDVSTLPADVQSDYAVFAQRCSKCHSLARPLESGINGDAFWRMYVEKMRRQPGSGISEADTVPILRFLHWYSVERPKAAAAAESAAAAVAADAGGSGG
ncbi:MAG TPA: hypothetical protein VF765_18050 [Polyangiaceae bacterium]